MNVDLEQVDEWYEGFIDGDGACMESLLGMVPRLVEEIRERRANEITVDFTRSEPEYEEVNWPGEFLKSYIMLTQPQYGLVLRQRGYTYTFRALAYDGVSFTMERGSYDTRG